MLRSLFSGISGMKSQQTKMDVIGNNISNVSTTAYKAQRATFMDALSQTMQSATSPTITIGGTNPKQVGLGVSIAGIDTDMSQGSLQPTNRASDLAIQGNGFFIVSDGINKFYTRDGSFTLDKNGDLLTSQGYHIMGINDVDTTSKYVSIPLEHDVVSPISIKDSNSVELFKMKIYGLDKSKIGNITVKNDASTIGTTMDVGSTKIKPYITVDASNNITINAGGITDITELEKAVNKTLSQVASLTEEQIADLKKSPSTGSNQAILNIRNFLETGINGIGFTGSGDPTKVGTTGSTVNNTDLKTEKVKLTSYGIGKDGKIAAVYGEDAYKVGEIQLAAFQNPAGLEKKGGNLYMESSNSGQATVGSASSAGYGSIEQGHLEMSKVDLANEFTEMIITSRAYQANSKTITTSDEMLEQLLNLKR